MKRVATLIAIVALMMAVVPGASAVVPTPQIKGGGTAQNDNSVVFPVGTVTEGTFVADYKDGVVQGKVKSKAVYNGVVLSELKGIVVCVAWTTGVTAGGQGWEIRIQVTESSGPYPVPVGAYGSIYVQDNGKTGDMVDEVFDPADLWDPTCGLNDASVGWEPMLSGGIKIKV